MNGTVRFSAASSGVLPIPMAIDAAMRIAASFFRSSALRSSSSGISVPLSPRSVALTKQVAFAASTSEAMTFP